MNRKGFIAVLLALATSLTMLTACGSDDPEPEVKPSAGYFTYYLLTNAETLNAMQITNTLYTNEEVKTGIITADKCITLAEVTGVITSRASALRNATLMVSASGASCAITPCADRAKRETGRIALYLEIMLLIIFSSLFF